MLANQQNKSAVFQIIFWVLITAHFLFFEILSRELFRTSFLEVVYRWLAEGELRIGILIFWIFSTLGWVALAGDHLRNVYVVATGKIESYVSLGDKLREGQYLYRDQDPTQEVIFAPSFILKNQYPGISFDGVYKRVYMLRDEEGNLTPTTDLQMSQVILMTFVQLGILLFSVTCIFFILGQFSKITASESRPAFEPFTVFLQSSMKWPSMLFILIINVGGTLLIFFCTRGMIHGGEIVLSIPNHIRSESVVEGQVVAFEKDAYPKQHSNSTPKFFKRFCVKFDERSGVMPPIYLNWVANAYHDGNISNTLGSNRRELIEERRLNDSIFAVMEAAIETRQYLKFTIDDDLMVHPKIEFP